MRGIWLKAGAAALGVSILTAGTSTLSGALFLASCRVNPAKAGPVSIMDYWQRYSADPVLARRLRGSIGISALLGFVVLPGVAAGALVRRRPLHGDARFANSREVRRSGLLGQEPGILVGRWRGQYLTHCGPHFVMLSAPTRSGKGVSIVIPNLLNWPDSVVVVDVKRENFEITAGYRRQCGQAVHLFAPFDEEGRSSRFNPLTYVRAQERFRVGDILGIATILYPLEMKTAGSSDAFFNDQARNFFLGLALYLVESPELPRTIGEMLRQASGKRKAVKDHLTQVIAGRQAEKRPLSDPCVDALMRFMATSENTLASILATFNAPLTIFADPVVDAATSGDDFLVTEVRVRPLSIYVHVPPNRLAQGALLVNLFFSILIDQNTRELPSQNPELRHTCLLLLDEFPALGRVVVLEKAVGFIAGYGLRVVTISQSDAMLRAIYGRDIARNLAANHVARIVFAPQELEDARDYCEALGYCTVERESRSVSRGAGRGASTSVSRSEERRALMLPQELREMDHGRQIVLLQSLRPILAEKIRFFEEPAFSSRLQRAPVVRTIDFALHQAKVEGRHRPVTMDDLREALNLEALAHRLEDLPPLGEQPSDEEVMRFAQDLLELLAVEGKSQAGDLQEGSPGAEGEGDGGGRASNACEAEQDLEVDLRG
jgi:type IV secretion system protein VirD4